MPPLPTVVLKPHWTTSDKQLVRLYHGDVIAVLKRLPPQSVHCVVTSPPYWGLRDYQTDKNYEIGSEATVAQFLDKMVAVFAEVRRVLRDDGTCWVNLGDTYSGGGGGGNGVAHRQGATSQRKGRANVASQLSGRAAEGLRPGNLVGVPWRVALALQADGWILRQDIVWHKSSSMPESVTNRCTKAHEYIFLLTKKQRYYYDAEAIKEPSIDPRFKYVTQTCVTEEGQRCNKRSVWTVASAGYEGAHFATFPPKLIEPCILAGTSEKGCCSVCGAPWVRVVSKTLGNGNPSKLYTNKELGIRNGIDGSTQGGTVGTSTTIGWKAGCECGGGVVACTVLDPFIGSGTTCCVSLAHGRRSVGIDLSEKYLRDNAIPRIEGELLQRPALAHLMGRTRKAFSKGVAVG